MVDKIVVGANTGNIRICQFGAENELDIRAMGTADAKTAIEAIKKC